MENQIIIDEFDYVTEVIKKELDEVIFNLNSRKAKLKVTKNSQDQSVLVLLSVMDNSNKKYVKYGTKLNKNSQTAEGYAMLFSKLAYILNELYIKKETEEIINEEA